jgi:hypothetical protein
MISNQQISVKMHQTRPGMAPGLPGSAAPAGWRKKPDPVSRRFI